MYNNSKWVKGRLLKSFAEALLALKQYDKAIQKLLAAQAITTSRYTKRRIAQTLAKAYEEMGDFKNALKVWSTKGLFTRWNTSPFFGEIRLLVKMGKLDRALAQSRSYCSGSKQIRSTYTRRRMCKQHQWLQYAMHLLQLPIHSKAFDKPPALPTARRRIKSNLLFRKMFKRLLKRGVIRRKAPIRPSVAPRQRPTKPR